MRLLNLEQNTPAWLNWRRGGLGGSDATIISGADVPWSNPLSPYQLWQLKTGRAEHQESTFSMRRGLRLEPLARRLYTERTGIPVRPVCVEHDTLPWLRSSLDGLDAWGDVTLELKCPNHHAHAEALAGRIPDYYVAQCVHQLAATGCGLLHYVSYSEHKNFGPDEQLALVELRPDRAAILQLLEQEAAFWMRVLCDFWPEDVAIPAPASIPGADAAGLMTSAPSGLMRPALAS